MDKLILIYLSNTTDLQKIVQIHNFLKIMYFFGNQSHQNCEEKVVLRNKCSYNQPVKTVARLLQKILVKELIFRKAAQPLTLSMSYLPGIFYGFSLKFSIHFCCRAPLFQNTSQQMFRVLFLLFPSLKSLKQNFLYSFAN